VEGIDDLQEKTVGLDTAPLIYFIEENPAYIETVRFFFEASDCPKFHSFKFCPSMHLSKKADHRSFNASTSSWSATLAYWME